MVSHLWNHFLSFISMEKGINFFWIAGFFLPAINATVFKQIFSRQFKDLKGTKTIMKICNPKLFFIGSRGTQSPIAETFFWLLAVCCGLWIYKGRCGLMASRLVRWCQRNCSQSSETHFYEWWKVIFKKRAVVI